MKTIIAPSLWQQHILHWYATHGRHNLPWQHPKTAYRVWVSEVMLQQTQVKTVIPYFRRFIKRFPSLKSLAMADLNEVLTLWTGLGYYSRARNLHRSAQLITTQHQGRFPKDIDRLTQLPGIGRSTAGAILAIAFNQATAILDGNVKRVLVRSHGIQGWPGQTKILKALWSLSEHYMPKKNCADYTQAMMDLGATLCTRTQPNCQLCPLKKYCVAYATDQVNTLPTPKPRQNKAQRACYLLLLVNNKQHVLLQQRPPTGIWGGLWSLPECPLEQDISAWCQQQWGLKITQVTPRPTFRHSFSHYDLDIHPMIATVKTTATIMDSNAYHWYDGQVVPGGLPAPVRRLLQEYWQQQGEFA